VGAVLGAFFLATAHPMSASAEGPMAEFGVRLMQHDVITRFVQAIFAGWLIALLVWVLPSAQSARLLTIMIFTYVVALAHLSHIVAGSAEAAYDVLSGGTTFGGYFGSFLAPTLTGNILGGVMMVTVLNHGAIAPEMDGKGGEG
jgi:formate/nitrite transporter FocA (FNT family)